MANPTIDPNENMQPGPEYRRGFHDSHEVDRLVILEHLGEIRRLQAELTNALWWVDELQSGMYINCVYCGYRYGPSPDTPIAMSEVLKQHVEVCPKHPASALKQQLAKANADIADAIESIKGHVTTDNLAVGIESLVAQSESGNAVRERVEALIVLWRKLAANKRLTPAERFIFEDNANQLEQALKGEPHA